MANGHGGDRRSAGVQQPPPAASERTNRQLLTELHRMENARLAESELDATNAVLDLAWPERYAALVAEAQRRKLCL